jgi:Arc/MetJ family transcription regulator
MTKTSVVIDRELARTAQAGLGTKNLREPVDAALRDVVDARRRVELIEVLRQEGRFDFAAAEQAWGGDA